MSLISNSHSVFFTDFPACGLIPPLVRELQEGMGLAPHYVQPLEPNTMLGPKQVIRKKEITIAILIPILYSRKLRFKEFPGGQVVKTLCFHCKDMGLILGQEIKIPHAAQWSQKLGKKIEVQQDEVTLLITHV